MKKKLVLSVILTALVSLMLGMVVNAAVPGDINGDSALANDDLTALVRYLSGSSVDVEQQNLDTNNDGRVNNRDAIAMAQTLAGWNARLHTSGRDSTVKYMTPNDGKALRIAFIGDSITEGIGSSNKLTDSYPAQLQELMGDKYVIGNFGKSGAYVLDADSEYNVKENKDLSYRRTQQYKDSLSFNADVVVVILGINDIRSMSCDAAVAELKAGLISLVEEYKALDGVQKVYVGLSVKIANTNIIDSFCDGPLQAIQMEVADECDVDTLDLWSLTRAYLDVNLHYTADKTHPNTHHYAELARAMYSMLMGESFTATVPRKSQTGVVYLKDGGATTGYGATPDTAIGSLAKAVGLLRNKGGTIVVCGPANVSYESVLPASNGTITITSRYNGVDHAETNGAYLGLSDHVYFNGNFNIDDINIVSNKANQFLVFGYNDVTIGEKVTCTLDTGVKGYPILLVGHSIELAGTPAYQFDLEGECNVTVGSGTWAYIRGGNRRTSGYCAIASSSSDARLNITINGGTFTNTATNLCSATGMGGFAGVCNFTINGGTFKGDVFAVGRVGNNLNGRAVMSGTVNVTVRGGTFNGGIKAVQDTNTISVTGKCNLNITEALKDKASGFGSVTVGGVTSTNIQNMTPNDGKALRIAIIGDSITEGIGATDKLTDSYPAQLQTMLGDKYVVGNFGKSGAYVLDADSKYNVKDNKDLSYRRTQQYKDSLSFNADVVVVILGINDIRSMSCAAAAAELKAGLISLVEEYKALDGVQKVYVGLSVRISNTNVILSYGDGPLQAIQKEAAAACNVDVLDLWSLTREYLDVKLHYTKDFTHPTTEQYTELARAMKALLLGEDFTPSIPDKSATGVVYVKTNGLATGLGATPDKAIDSLAKAVGLLRDGGGTVVICGPYDLEHESMLPVSTGTIVITSEYNGVDYSEQNGAYFGLAKNVYFHGDYSIDDLNILVQTGGRMLVFGYNDVNIGNNVTCTLAEGISSYPALIVGHNIELEHAPAYQFVLKGECNVTVGSGTWTYIRGGNRRVSGYCAIASSAADAKLNITINGGMFTNTSSNLCAGTGMGGFAGVCNFTINGGTFMGNVYAVSRAANNLNGKAVMDGTVNMTVNGGSFKGSIIAVQDSTVTVTGNTTLTIISSLKDNASGFTTVTVK